jgi:glutaredoxin-dependent peroxiredoxin
MRLPIFLNLISVMIIFGLAQAQSGETLKVGDRIPDFKLAYATQDTVVFDGISSDDMKGKRYLVATFPAAWSPGCTKEMCTFRDTFADLAKLNIEILAVSGDYVFTQHEWAKYQKFSFKLMSDPTREFGRKLGVYNDQNGFFKRAIFVVGPDGLIQYINYNYSVADEKDYNTLKAFLAQK